MANPIISLKTAQLYDIEAYEGDTTGMVLELLDDESVAYSVDDAEVKVRTKDGSLVQTMNEASTDVVISGGGSNIITITGWEDLTQGTYDYDLAIIVGAERRTLLTGELRVTADV